MHLGIKDKEILSREWCDMLFEDRNKEYGAYVLRSQAGHRYAVVLRVIGGVVLGFLVAILAAGYFLYRQVQDVIAELDEMERLERIEPKMGHEFRDVAQGRRAVPHMKPGATQSRPEIVEGMAVTLDFGIDGPESLRTEEEVLLLEDQDPLHNREQLDLPEEGVLLTPTEVVEEMPRFPGGIGALMKWLDTHIIYTPASLRENIEGDMEVTFLVSKDGKVLEPKVTRSLCASLDRSALGALHSMPRWEPGRSNGRVTVVQITLPIHFQKK